MDTQDLRTTKVSRETPFVFGLGAHSNTQTTKRLSFLLLSVIISCSSQGYYRPNGVKSK